MVKIITYLRAVFVGLYALIHTLIFSILVLLAGALGLQKLATQLIRLWSGIALFLLGIRLEVRGEENLPGAGGGIVVFNHQSHFDIPALALATPKMIRFGAKIELFKIPFFGAAMRSIGTLPIARDNRNEVLRTYKEAERRFQEGTLFVLAPEGTRQKEPVLGRFKKGPFVFALSAGVPIIPAVIKGNFYVLPKDSLMVNVGQWTRTVTIEFLKPVATSDWKNQPLEAIVSHVRDQMAIVYDSLPTHS